MKFIRENIPIYKFGLVYWIGDPEGFAEWLLEVDRDGYLDIAEDIRRRSCDGFCEEDDGHFLLFIANPLDFGLIAHEAFHLTVQVMRKIGASLTGESEESFAYLHQWLVEDIHGVIRGNFTKKGVLRKKRTTP